MNYVTVVNRTSKPLEGLWDGIRYPIPPGESALPELVAIAAKRQNPIMGSEDPYSLRIASLIGIKDRNDDCSPIEQTTAIERWDRSMGNFKPTEVVKGKTGLYGHEISAPLPGGGGFVNPNG